MRRKVPAISPRWRGASLVLAAASLVLPVSAQAEHASPVARQPSGDHPGALRFGAPPAEGPPGPCEPPNLPELLPPADGTPLVIRGRVLRPDGTAAHDAVVVTSAGGRSLAGQEGVFDLSVHVPAAAERLQVAAVSSGLMAVTTVTSPAAGATRDVGSLRLALSTTSTPSWLPTFGSKPHTDNSVTTFAVFDDGTGPALYAGGPFTIAGGLEVNCVARWDGTYWSALGGGIGQEDFVNVASLAVFDDGTGPALYVGGYFNEAGDASAHSIARWDGTTWSALGDGIDGVLFQPTVYALEAFDDGSGPALYAGGFFSTAGGVASEGIARWDGSTWSSVGGGVNAFAYVTSFEVFDDGNGPALYAGGGFSLAGGVPASNIARWDGVGWSALGSGTDAPVLALAVHDDGTGPALHVGGSFSAAGGLPAAAIAAWDGLGWASLSSSIAGGYPDYVDALAVFDDGDGPALHAGGAFTTLDGQSLEHIARWNGVTWTHLASGTSCYVHALGVFDDGDGPALFAGGEFTHAGGTLAVHVARWKDAAWAPVGAINGTTRALVAFDDAAGPALYAGGSFTDIGGTVVKGVARWDGASWSALGDGMDEAVQALAAFDDGSGPALHAGGVFTTAGGVLVGGIAKWNGQDWSALDGGLDNPDVQALATFDDGSGPALYVGGAFFDAGGVVVNHVARWDGSAWSALAQGLNHEVRALAVFDDGAGPALYAAGQFGQASSVTAKRIAKWDGSGWSAVGGGMDGFGNTVDALAAFDDGGGVRLYAGGDFDVAGGVPTAFIAAWDGAAWAPVGSGMDGPVRSLAVFDDGGGPALFAGGEFTTAGGIAAQHVARWDGSSWTPLEAGVNDAVLALAVFDDGGGPALLVGGVFDESPAGDSFLARWACPSVLSAWSEAGAGLGGAFGVPILKGKGSLAPASSGSLKLMQAQPFSPTLLFASWTSAPASFKGGTLVPLPPAVLLAGLSDGAGQIEQAWAAWPPDVPPGTSIYVQQVAEDSTAVKGVALSNALLGITP